MPRKNEKRCFDLLALIHMRQLSNQMKSEK